MTRALGRGAFGRVYAAIDALDGRDVAIKFFMPRSAAWRHLEAQKLAQIQHPNVVPVLAAGERHGTPFVVMPLVNGRPLSEHLEERPMAPRRALALLADVAAGLDAAHVAGFVHCDIKPSNIMVAEEPNEHGVLLDFGTTATIDGDTSGSFAGTPAYAAPELLAHDRITHAADIYALAAVLFECLTGTRPFSRPTIAETALAHLVDSPPMLALDHPVGQVLQPVLQRGLARDPASRYATASQLIDAARSALEILPAELVDVPLGMRGSTTPAPTTVHD